MFKKSKNNLQKNIEKHAFLQNIKNRGINKRQRPQRILSFSKKYLGGHNEYLNNYFN